MRLGQFVATLSAEMYQQTFVIGGQQPDQFFGPVTLFPTFPARGPIYLQVLDSADLQWTGLNAWGYGKDLEWDWLSGSGEPTVDAPSMHIHQYVAPASQHAAVRQRTLSADALDNVCRLLAELWISQTNTESSLERIFGHPAFQQIVDFGTACVPFMLSNIDAEPERWSVGLALVTGERPVPDDASAVDAARIWKQWELQNG